MVVAVEGDDRAMAYQARRAGLAVQAVNDWRIANSGHAGLIMSFTNIISQKMAQQQVAALKQAIK